MTLRCWTHEPLSDEVERALRRICALDDVAVVAAMPDVHLAKGVCVGAVVGTRSTLMPDAVGGDIGCGMAAVSLGVSAETLRPRQVAARVLRALADAVPTSRHRARGAALPDELAGRPLSARALDSKAATIGRVQHGTLGRGNHFVELQRDVAGELWLMVHSGSRGIGQAIRDHHGGADGGLRAIEAASEAGEAYLHDVAWALDYAASSRRRMVEAVATALRDELGAEPDWSGYLECHHNAVRREQHGNELLWVHRKGAIAAAAGEPGIIPGSMGSASFHVTGRGCAEALCSSSHGAGRVMSRTDARRAISARALVRAMTGVWFDDRLTDRLRDEAPQAYKDIGAVMRAQRELTRIVRHLEPVLVYKGT